MLRIKIVPVILLFLSLFISVSAQSPPIGTIDFYGLNTLSKEQVQAALRIKEGDPVPPSKAEVEDRLTGLPNVEQAKLNFVCCEAGKLFLFVGIREKGSPTLRFRPAPAGEILLPDQIIKAADDFYEALKKAILKGDIEEDDSEGHALMKNAEARALQEKFIPLANQNLNLLRRVLRQSKNAEHRAVAAQIIPYYRAKKAIVKELVYGINDESGDVRNNSMRALGRLARYASKNPNKNIKVPVTPFIEMLNSIDWTDRNKSSLALWQLTENRDPAILAELRRRALASLIEISRWKSPGYAFPGFILLARMAAIPEDEILKLWESGQREKVIEPAQKKSRIN